MIIDALNLVMKYAAADLGSGTAPSATDRYVAVAFLASAYLIVKSYAQKRECEPVESQAQSVKLCNEQAYIRKQRYFKPHMESTSESSSPTLTEECSSVSGGNSPC